MSLKLAARLVGLVPAKILDLQENDTAEHTADLSAFVPPGAVAIIYSAIRVTGTGIFRVYPRSKGGAFNTYENGMNLLTIENQELKWKNSVANDDWDIHLIGYFVQKRTR